MRNTFDEAKERATKTRKPPKKNYFNVKITLHDTVYNINVLLVPVAIVVDYYEYYKNKWYHSLTWNEKKATKLLDRTLPKVVEYDEDENTYWYSTTWRSCYFTDKAPLGMRTWARKFRHEVINFIRDGYENPNYIKTLEDVDGWDEWVKFTPVNYINGKKDNQVVTGERQEEMDKNIPKF